MASSTDLLTIDWDTRKITIPSTITIIGVEHDLDSNRLYFQCPATYCDEFDISTYGIRICFGNYNSNGTEVAADFYEVDDAVSDGENITFSWLVGANAYQTKGYVYFIVCCKYMDSDGNLTSDLNTTLAKLSVLEGRECNTDEVVLENYSDLYYALISLQEALNAAEAARVTAEAARVTAEKARVAAETARVVAENAREEASATAVTNANEAAVSANLAAAAVFSNQDLYLLLNSNGKVSIVYDDGE